MEKVKAGLRTSEFWVSMLGAAIPLVNQYMGLALPAEAIVSVAGVLATYVFGRSFLKAKAAGE